MARTIASARSSLASRSDDAASATWVEAARPFRSERDRRQTVRLERVMGMAHTCAMSSYHLEGLDQESTARATTRHCAPRHMARVGMLGVPGTKCALLIRERGRGRGPCRGGLIKSSEV